MPTLPRRTKIICTLGPSTDNLEVLKQLLEGGLNVARINTAHGTPAEHGERIDRVRKLASRLKRPLGILVDLPGPKFRLGELPQGSMELRRGMSIVLGNDASSLDAIPVTYPRLAQDVVPGEALYLADGTMKLVVIDIRGGLIHCRVEIGGTIRSHSGINLPDSKISVTLPTEDDLQWIEFACAYKVEWIGVSFVRTAADLVAVRRHLGDEPDRPMLIAKIEKRQALERLESIIEEADGVMVARGDLGVETPLAEVPLAQKRIILEANRRGKPVVTATQMLESMVEHGSPTRAEVTDVANAVLDGTDAVMLSAETAIGAHPVAAVKVLVDVIAATEAQYPYDLILNRFAEKEWSSVADAMSFVACRLAMKVNARAIVVPLKNPETAFRIARFHPEAPIVAFSAEPHLAQQLNVASNVIPLVVPTVSSRDVLGYARQWLLDQELAHRGDLMVVVSDSSRGEEQLSDSLRVVKI